MGIIRTSTVGMTKKDWLGFRSRGFGASEVGATFGLSEYESIIDIFHSKSNSRPKFSANNMRKFMGHFMEDPITEMWEHWEKDEATMLVNFENGKKVRRAEKVNAYLQNEDFPWLFASLDRRINKHKSLGNGALELKTISGYVAKKFINGIPPQYMMQLQTQCLIAGYEYGELCTLEDGHKLNVHEFEYDKQVGEAIVEHTHTFWQQILKARVVKAQIFEAERNYNQRLAEELRYELQELEPSPDGSAAYLDFINDNFKESNGEGIKADVLQIDEARKLYEAKEEIKKAKENSIIFESKLKYDMKETEVLDMGKNGSVTWRTNKAGHRVFKNNYIPDNE